MKTYYLLINQLDQLEIRQQTTAEMQNGSPITTIKEVTARSMEHALGEFSEVIEVLSKAFPFAGWTYLRLVA